MVRGMMKTLIMTISICVLSASSGYAYNYGDFKSETLASKAWAALAEGDLDAVLAYTNKCIELYGSEAKKMQASLDAYPQGDDEKIFSYWALNDIATSLFIQGEAYRKAHKKEKAMDAYEKVVQEYTYGQAWDPKGWFWKPAEAAKEKFEMLATGSKLDFGDYSSSFLTTKAWQAMSSSDTKSVIKYTDKVLELYEEEAKSMQKKLQSTTNQYPFEKEVVFSYWALNDVGTSLFIKGETLRKSGKAQVWF